MDRLTENEKIVLQAYIKDEFCDSGVDSTFWAGQMPFPIISRTEGLKQEPLLKRYPRLTKKTTKYQDRTIGSRSNVHR